jgi:hypothetical protein
MVDDPARLGALGFLATADVLVLVVALCIRPRPDTVSA